MSKLLTQNVARDSFPCGESAQTPRPGAAEATSTWKSRLQLKSFVARVKMHVQRENANDQLTSSFSPIFTPSRFFFFFLFQHLFASHQTRLLLNGWTNRQYLMRIIYIIIYLRDIYLV